MSIYEITYRIEKPGETVDHETRRRLEKERLFEEVGTEVLETGIRRKNGSFVGVAYVRASYAADREPFPTADTVREIEAVGELSLDTTGTALESTAQLSPDGDKDRFRQSEVVARRVESVAESPSSGLMLNPDLTLSEPHKRDCWLVGESSEWSVENLTKADILEFYRTFSRDLCADLPKKIGVYNDGSQVELFLVHSFKNQETATEFATQEGAYGPTNFHRLELSKTAVILGNETHVPGELDARFRSDEGETVTSRQILYTTFYLHGRKTNRRRSSVQGVAYHPLGVHANGTLYHPVGPDGEPAGDWKRITLETYRRGGGRPWQFGLVQTDDAFLLTQAMAGPTKFDPVLKRYPIERVTLEEPLVFNGDIARMGWPSESGKLANRKEGTDVWVLYRDSTGWHLEQPFVEDSDDADPFAQTSIEGIECHKIQSESAPPDRIDQADSKTSVEREYRLTEEALLTYEKLYVLAGHECREESAQRYQWQLDDAMAYEVVPEMTVDEGLLREAFDFAQDNSGMLAAGAVVDWARRTGREPEAIESDEFENFREWADRTDPFYPPTTISSFEQVLDWLEDPRYPERAYRLYRVRELYGNYPRDKF